MCEVIRAKQSATKEEERGAAMSQAHEVQQHLAEVQALVVHLETASWTE